MNGGMRILRPLSARDFALLWGGQSVSLIGDGIFTVTLAWQTLLLSSKPTTLAAVLFARSVPQLLLLMLGGVVTDRVPRRRLLIVSDIARGLAVGTVALLVATGRIEVWHLIGLGAVFGTANALFFPAYTAIVPEVLTPELLPAGNALNTTSRLIGTNFAGPALGGLIVASFGTGWAFGADFLSFVVAAVSAWLIRTVPPPEHSPARMAEEFREAFRFTRSQPWLWVTLLSAGVGNLAFSSLAVILPVLVKVDLNGGAAALGAVSASFGAGGLLAAIGVGLLGLPRRRIAAMYAGWFLAALAMAGLGIVPAVATAAAVGAACGLFLEFGTLIWVTLMQELVPRKMLGRVSALDWMLSLGLAPVAFALAGPLTAAAGPGPVLIGGGLLAAAANAVAVTRRGVIDPDRASRDDTDGIA